MRCIFIINSSRLSTSHSLIKTLVLEKLQCATSLVVPNNWGWRLSLSDLKVVLNVLLEKEVSTRGGEIVALCVKVTLKMVGVVFIH